MIDLRVYVRDNGSRLERLKGFTGSDKDMINRKAVMQR